MAIPPLMWLILSKRYSPQPKEWNVISTSRLPPKWSQWLPCFPSQKRTTMQTAKINFECLGSLCQ